MRTLACISTVAWLAIGCGSSGSSGTSGRGGSGGAPATRTYTTNFPLTENPISEGSNGVAVGTATDSTYATGSPGMGFNLETADSSCLGTNGDYGFTSLTATGS